jgi:hypothetical protein
VWVCGAVGLTAKIGSPGPLGLPDSLACDIFRGRFGPNWNRRRFGDSKALKLIYSKCRREQGSRKGEGIE